MKREKHKEGKKQRDVCIGKCSSLSFKMQRASPQKGHKHPNERLDLEFARPNGEKRYQYLSSLLPLTVTRSFHVPRVVFTLPRSNFRLRW